METLRETDSFRVMLLRPSGCFQTLTFPDGPLVSPPMGLLYIGAAIKKLPDVEVRVIDCLAHPESEQINDGPPYAFGMSKERMLQEIKEFVPDMLGIMGHSYYYFHDVVEAINTIHQAFPGIFLFGGGPDITADYERYFQATKGLVAVVVGEGEETTTELVQKYKDGTGWKETKGLAYRSDDTIVKTPSRPFFQDIDSYLPDYSLLDLEHYFSLNQKGFRARTTYDYPGVHRAVDIITSRGCPYKCTFCSIFLHMGRKYRTQSISVVLDHMALLIERYGVRHFHFEDDNLSLDKKRFKQMLQGIIERGWNITWDTPNGIRADFIDEEILTLCKASGCSHLILGVESGNQRVLDEIIIKEIKLEDIERAAALCQKAEIDALAFFIVGFPGETRREIEETYSFAFKLLSRYGTTPVLQLWRPLRGTALHQQVKENGTLKSSEPDRIHDTYGVPYVAFKDDIGDSDEYSIDDLALVYQRYLRDMSTYGTRKWLKILIKRPSAWWKVFRDVAVFLLSPRYTWHEKKMQGSAKIYNLASYPYAYLRGLGER